MPPNVWFGPPDYGVSVVRREGRWLVEIAWREPRTREVVTCDHGQHDSQAGADACAASWRVRIRQQFQGAAPPPEA